MHCSQCSRAAFYQMQNGSLLCVEHYNMVAQNAQAAMATNAAMINYLSDQIYATFGLPPRGPRIQIPQSGINSASVTYNHINVDRSVIGAINTAQVGRIDVAMDDIQNNGDEDVAKAIRLLTETVIATREIKETEKQQVIEQLAFLAEQATLPQSQRQKSVVKMVLTALAGALTNAASVATIWSQWGGSLTSFFHH
ncbi:MAG TPA: hypothetical protein VLG40_02845 [Candidatus Saccharimonas sp.]|nr:hypothetical protein [Candidatus Saccharimonas sp.]